MAAWTTWKILSPSILLRAPKQPGVYEVALDGRRYSYPWGFSGTIYYGMSDTSIVSRLSAHYSGSGSPVIHDLLAAPQRLKVRWKRTSNGRKSPREIECLHIERFTERFGSRPLGNRQGCAVTDN